MPINPTSSSACETLSKASRVAGKRMRGVYGFFLRYERMPSAVAAPKELISTPIPACPDRCVDCTKLVFCEFDRYFNQLLRRRLNLWIVKTYWFFGVHLGSGVCVDSLLALVED
jgi:hypothetical protein